MPLKSSALLRKHIEEVLADRIPAPLTTRERAELDRLPCGIPSMDELLNGGLPIGVLTEFVGLECSGRTSIALAYLSAVTRSGNVCAWIDVADALDPETVAANGVDLKRLLWVRCGLGKATPSQATPEAGQRAPDPITASIPQRHAEGGSPHPRTEGRDMPQAISAMLQAHGGLHDRQIRRERKTIGTPGMANRPLPQRSENREEQISTDRLPARRGDDLAIVARCAEPQPRRTPELPDGKRMPLERSGSRSPQESSISPLSKPWQALDQALRTTDLLLQSGGFSVLVLDLGSVAPEFAWRIPLATWFRFRAACERTRVSLVLLTQHPCTRSSAELVVRLQVGTMEAQSKVMTGIRYCAVTERNRSQESKRVVPIRKPPQSERQSCESPGQWKSEATWVQAK